MEQRPAKDFHRPSRNRILLALVIYLLGFGVLLITVCRGFLFPAMIAAANAKAAMDTKAQHRLQGTALLILLCTLFVLFAGLLMVFRIGRFFFPRPPAPRSKTDYVDAWAESGRRMNVPSDEKPPE